MQDTIMNQRFILFRRSGVYYCEDIQNRKGGWTGSARIEIAGDHHEAAEESEERESR